MRKLLGAFVSAIVVCVQLSLSAILIYDANIDIGAGYRQDSLNWNISGLHKKPDVLSELEWKSLRMVQISGLGKVVVCDWMVRAQGDYARIFHGRTRDSDYDKSGRRDETFRFLCNSGRGEAFDLSLGAGYQLSLFCDVFTLTPVLGYSWHEQHLRMFEGDVLIFNRIHERGTLPDLHSNYRTRWRGPWIGVDGAFHVPCMLDVYGSLEYHFAHYHATGHWNMRSDFYDDFHHLANGHGILAIFGIDYPFFECVKLGAHVTYIDMRAKHGKDRTPLLDDIIDSVGNLIGTEKVIAETHLNEVNWRSFRIEVDFAFYF